MKPSELLVPHNGEILRASVLVKPEKKTISVWLWMEGAMHDPHKRFISDSDTIDGWEIGVSLYLLSHPHTYPPGTLERVIDALRQAALELRPPPPPPAAAAEACAREVA